MARLSPANVRCFVNARPRDRAGWQPTAATQVLLACETRVALHGLQADSARHYNGRWVQQHVTAWVAL